MTWTTDKPTKEGYYWHRWEWGAVAMVEVSIEVINGQDFSSILSFGSEGSVRLAAEDGEWYGPLEPPK